jgi:hypothetical protein
LLLSLTHRGLQPWEADAEQFLCAKSWIKPNCCILCLEFSIFVASSCHISSSDSRSCSNSCAKCTEWLKLAQVLHFADVNATFLIRSFLLVWHLYLQTIPWHGTLM